MFSLLICSNPIRASVDRIRMSVDRLIVFLKAIRIFVLFAVARVVSSQKYFRKDSEVSP
jgi:hypothetical protein